MVNNVESFDRDTVRIKVHRGKRDNKDINTMKTMFQSNNLPETTKPMARDPNHTDMDDAKMQRVLDKLDTSLNTYLVREHDLEQCQQLYNFQHSYKDVKAELEEASEMLRSFSYMILNLPYVEPIFSTFFAFEKRVYELLDQASSIAWKGDQLIQNSYYGMDIIQPACSELRETSEELSSKLRATSHHFVTYMELHHCMEEALKWIDERMFALAPKLVDMCQSHKEAKLAQQELEDVENESQNQMSDLSTILTENETVLNQQFKDQLEKVLQKQKSMKECIWKWRVSLKEVAAKQTCVVQPVAPRAKHIINSPPSSPAHGAQQEERCSISCEKGNDQVPDEDSRHASLSEEEEKLAVRRRYVMDELLDTERAYVEDLLCVLKECAFKMDNPAMSHLIPAPLKNKKQVLFGNLSEIYIFHINFLRKLEKCIDCPELVGRCLSMKDLQMYEVYILNKPRSEKLWSKYSNCVFFQECQKNLKHGLGLHSYLMKPVQRLINYPQILKEMLKYSTDCEGAADLQEALTSISAMLKAINDSLHMTNIRGLKGNLNELGKLLMQGSFIVWKDHERSHVTFPRLSRVQLKQRHLFLFENALVFCERKEKGKGYIYTFKRSLSMSAVDIAVNASTFEIWCNSRKKVYVVEAPSAEIKNTWVNDVRNIVAAQREACREDTRPGIR